ACRRIAENRMVAGILRLQTELEALAFGGPPALEKRGVKSVDPRSANPQRAGRRTERVGRGPGEGALVEIIAHAVVNRARSSRVADQIRPLGSIPKRAAGLTDLDREAGLQ